MAAFKQVMTQEAKGILQCCPCFERKACSLTYLGEAMEPPILSINDE